jgi:hypothetical protein
MVDENVQMSNVFCLNSEFKKVCSKVSEVYAVDAVKTHY